MLLKKIEKFKDSLSVRLTFLYAVTFTVLSTGGYLVFYYQIHDIAMEHMDLELLGKMQKYTDLIKKEDLETVKTAIVNEADPEERDEDFYRLLNGRGDTLFTTDMSSWGTIADKEILLKIQNQELKYAIQTVSIDEGDDKARMITAVIGPGIVLQIGESLEEVEDYLDIFFKLFSIMTLSMIVVSTIIGWFLAKRATRDMQEVTQTAEDISNGAYDRRVQVKGRLKEIEHLGATFNLMLDRIQSLLETMKEINDNIAHDLRSPLARIRGIAEMNLLKERSIDEYKEMASGTIEECDALISMINTMLEITETEAGVSGNEEEEVELSALIREACELFRPTAEEKKIQLKTDLPESLVCQSHRKKMQRIVTNLLENAIKYTPPDGSVVVSATAYDEEIRIEFKDTGIGISETDLPHIFQRFYRCSRSRSEGGVGLGLSLAKAYTESLKGTIDVDSTLNQGSHFIFRFAR